MASIPLDIALPFSIKPSKIGPKAPKNYGSRVSLMNPRVGTCAYAQICAYAHFAEYSLVRMHRGLCVRTPADFLLVRTHRCLCACTLDCVLPPCFLHVFSLCTCFLPLFPSYSCLIDLKSLTKHIMALNGIKVGLNCSI